MKSSYGMTPSARFALVVSVLVAALLLSGASTASAAEASGDGSQTVLITGSNRGIGLAFAGFYASDPAWRVIATCRRPEQADDLKALAAEHGNLVIEPLDVTRDDQISALVERYEGQPIDLLINNAAISSRAEWPCCWSLPAWWILACCTSPVTVARSLLPTIASPAWRKSLPALRWTIPAFPSTWKVR